MFTNPQRGQGQPAPEVDPSIWGMVKPNLTTQAGFGANENPPPVPPRTYNRNSMQNGSRRTSQPYGGTLDGYPSNTQSGISVNRPQSMPLSHPSTNPQHRGDPLKLISFSPPGTDKPKLNVLTSSSSFNDLDGLDFSAPSTTPTVQPDTTDKSELSHMYPDISAAFRELNRDTPSPINQSINQPFPGWGTVPPSQSNIQRQSMPVPYGWDQALTQQASSIGQGVTSVPSTPVQGSGYFGNMPTAMGGGMGAYNLGMSFQPANPNVFPGFDSSDAFMAGGLTKPFSGNNSNSNNDKTDETDYHFVPNLDFDSWTDSDAFSVSGAQSTLSNQNSVSDPRGRTHKRQSSDLIQLGFDGLLTSDEKEYFSLEYFDPLHRKGRTASISSPHSTGGYFFAKPPEDKSVVCKERDAWVTFDDSGMFGDKHGEDATDRARVDTSKNVESPDLTAEGPNESHGKLRKKLFVDEESDCFCQMVADLKKENKSTDERTNLGFIVSPLCEKQQDSMSVKIVVHSEFATEPCSFTCDVHSPVEHVINHILYSCLSTSLPRHMLDALKTEDFILKVYDRSEYLLSEFALSKYRYTHDCLKMDLDLCFSIMRRQDVALPFIRTVDDDNQQLYFPQDHAQETDVSRESLEILIDTFYKESEKISDLVLRDEVQQVQFQSLKQAVKAVCNILSKIETIDIAKSLFRIESILQKIKQEVKSKSSTLEHAGGGYGTLQRGSFKVSLIQELEEGLEKLQSSIKQLVRIYCQAFHTDFRLDSRIDQPWDEAKDSVIYKYPQDVTGFNETFIVQICTVHRIPNDWAERFDEYKVECALYHGKRKLHEIPVVSSTCASVCRSGLVPIIVWDEWLTFDDLSLCILPRESRLCVTLVGLKTTQTGNTNSPETQKIAVALGGVTIQLFNRRGYMLQGSQLVPFQMNAAADPITPFCSTLQTDSALLQLNLPDFGKQILFSEPLRIQDSPKKSMNDLAPQVREEIEEVLKKDCVSSCTADQLEVLWLHRHYFYDYPGLLPWILQAATHWDWAALPEIYILLQKWTTLLPMQSLELLLPQYPDLKVRAFAVDCLRKMPTDDLIDFIPQLIQALKYESYHSSPLARLLLEQSCKSVRFAHQFFWLLKGATQDTLYKRRYELMFVALVSVAGEALYQEFKKQEEIVKVISVMAEKVQKAPKDKEGILRNQLLVLHDKFMEKNHILLPHNPGFEVSGIVANSCSFFTSNAFPIKLVFKNRTENAGPVYAMMKVGDDLRQDMMMMQFIRIMDRLWLKEGLDLKMITFNCLPTGPRRGFIEIITEADTLRRIQVSSGVTGSFKDRPIKDWLQKHNPTELDYQKAVENFTRSCAGYCVATYILGVCDRHNDNIMLKQTGHLFHIDFNKILGDSQMFGNFKRDRVPFVLTSDMAYVINDGDRQTDKFQHFIDICCQAFNILRKHANLFINLLSLMLRSAIPGITDKGVEFVQLALLPERTETQAAVEFTKMIQESLSAKSTQINFFIHNLAQMKFSSHNEGALLSFIPKVYSQQTDGKIKHVEVYGFQKRYTPEKHYIYTLKIERESQKVHSFVFRIYSEFVEFRNKLAALFPLVNWPPLQGRVLLGRSHVKTVAEGRKADIENFMQSLFNNTSEISHSDIVYTFLHPLLRDEQEAQKGDNLHLPKLRVSRQSSGKAKALSSKTSPLSPENPILNQTKDGQVKLSLEYIKDSLHIMVMHAKDLPMHGSELPSPYVKTYLLPDPEKQTKRKTKIIKATTHPTYNEVIEYNIPLEKLRSKILQVTIWDHDVLKENDLLGAVYIKLQDFDRSTTISRWYKLEKLQITDINNL